MLLYLPGKVHINIDYTDVCIYSIEFWGTLYKIIIWYIRYCWYFWYCEMIHPILPISISKVSSQYWYWFLYFKSWCRLWKENGYYTPFTLISMFSNLNRQRKKINISKVICSWIMWLGKIYFFVNRTTSHDLC